MLATTPSRTRWATLALTITTVELALTTIPHPLVARFSWLPRIGLAGFTAVTIGAYLIIGPYFTLGWVAKAVEVAILTLLAADVLRVYGSFGGLVRVAIGTFRGRGSTPMQAA